jgi:hypothetical protein
LVDFAYLIAAINNNRRLCPFVLLQSPAQRYFLWKTSAHLIAEIISQELRSRIKIDLYVQNQFLYKSVRQFGTKSSI